MPRQDLGLLSSLSKQLLSDSLRIDAMLDSLAGAPTVVPSPNRSSRATGIPALPPADSVESKHAAGNRRQVRRQQKRTP